MWGRYERVGGELFCWTFFTFVTFAKENAARSKVCKLTVVDE